MRTTIYSFRLYKFSRVNLNALHDFKEFFTDNNSASKTLLITRLYIVLEY